MPRIFILFVLVIFASPAWSAERIAYFAGGCFWCTEADFAKLAGVRDVVSGYMGGVEVNPVYADVASGRTGHKETVKVVYDDNQISYQKLLSAFWRMHDPSDAGGSFVDRGQQYGSAIFYTNQQQKRLAEGAVQALTFVKKFPRPIATKILPAKKFYVAEAYHQDYAKHHSFRYNYYRRRSGRDQFITRVWKNDTALYQLTSNN